MRRLKQGRVLEISLYSGSSLSYMAIKKPIKGKALDLKVKKCNNHVSNLQASSV